MGLVLACLTCWWDVGNGNDSGISCRWLLTSACAALAGTILALWAWARSKDTRIEQLHAEKDVVQDARLADFKDRYDRLARRKDKDSSDT